MRVSFNKISEVMFLHYFATHSCTLVCQGTFLSTHWCKTGNGAHETCCVSYHSGYQLYTKQEEEEEEERVKVKEQEKEEPIAPGNHDRNVCCAW